MISRAALLGGDDPIEFVSAQGVLQSDGSGNCSFSMANVLAGDLMAIAVAWTNAKPTVTGGDGTASWTWDLHTSGASYFGVLWKRLSAADKAAGSITVNGAVSTQEMYSVAYRGPRSLAVRTKAASAGGDTTLNLTGYTPIGTGVGALVLVWDNGEATVPAAPTGFTSRVSGGARACRAVDNFDYRGATVNVTGFGAGQPQLGLLIELIT